MLAPFSEGINLVAKLIYYELISKIFANESIAHLLF